MIRHEITIDDNLRAALGLDFIEGQYFVFTEPGCVVRLVPEMLLSDEEIEVYRDPVQLRELQEGLESLARHGSHRSPELEAMMAELDDDEDDEDD